MLFRRKETPWEVVGIRTVEPIAMFDEGDVDALDVVRVSDMDMRSTFSHEVKGIQDMRVVIYSARHQLMQDLVRQNYNMLLSEGWTITIFRKGSKYRAEVTYTGRPGFVTGKPRSRPPPPFMAVLDMYKHDMSEGVEESPQISPKTRSLRLWA